MGARSQLTIPTGTKFDLGSPGLADRRVRASLRCVPSGRLGSPGCSRTVLGLADKPRTYPPIPGQGRIPNTSALEPPSKAVWCILWEFGMINVVRVAGQNADTLPDASIIGQVCRDV